MKTKKQVIDFLEGKLGTKVICKGNPSLDGQCVTLIKSLMEFLGVSDPYKPRGDAKDCISNYLKEGIADKGIGFISVFSNKNMAKGVGHIWCNAGDGEGTYYESNGAKLLIVTKGKTYSYDSVCNFDKYIKDEKISQGKEPEKGNNMSETALETCLRQHSDLVTELDELKPELERLKSDLDSCNRSKSQIVSDRDRLKAIKAELVKLTGKEVDKAEDDVANALNHYYVTERNKETDLEKQEKATTAPQKAVTEGAKEPIRIALSALVGFAVATAYTKYPFLGQIEPDQQVVIMAVVGVLTRTLNELIHNYGKNIGNDLLKTGFLDVSLVSYIQERLINSIKSSKNENSSN